jgi:membrane protein implicated in regulation of membrane protease activity
MVPGMIWISLCFVCIAIDIVVPGFVFFIFGMSAAFTSLLFITHSISTLQSQILVFCSATVTLLSIWFMDLKKRVAHGAIIGNHTQDENCEEKDEGE